LGLAWIIKVNLENVWFGSL